MNWFEQMSGAAPNAGVSRQDATRINDAIYHGTSDAMLSGTETRTPPLPGFAGPARTDETKRRQLALPKRYVAQVRLR